MINYNMCRIALLGIIALQLHFSPPVYAADAPKDDVSAETKDFADGIKKLKLIIQKFPGTDQAANAQRNVTIAYIQNADLVRAQKELELFLTQYCFPATLRQYHMKPIFRACLEADCWEDFLKVGDEIMESADDERSLNALTIQTIAHAYFKNMPASLEKLYQLRTRYSSHEKFPEYLFNISTEYWTAAAHAESIQLAEEIVEKYPKHIIVPEALTSLAVKYFKMGNMSVSKQMLGQLRTRYGTNEKFPEYLFSVSQAWWTIKTRPESIRLAEEIVEMYPQHKVVPDTLNELAIRYIYVDKLSASKQALHQLRTKYGTHEKFPEYLVYISRWYWGEGAAKDESIQMVREVLEKYPNHKAAPDALKELIARYPSLGKRAEANQMLNQLRSRYSTHEKYPEYLLFISRWYWKAEAKDKSLELAQEIVDKYPKHRVVIGALRDMAVRYALMDNWSASVQKADQLLSQFLYNKQLPAILKALDRFYKRRATDLEIKNWRNSRLIKLVRDSQKPAVKKQGAILCIVLLDEQAAIEIIAGDSASDFVKKYSAADLMELLSFCREKGKSSLAIKLCQKYLKGQPTGRDRETIELQLLTNWFLSGDDPMSLVPHLDEFILKNKTSCKSLSAQAIILKGRIIMYSGDAEKAIVIFQKAIDQYPDISEVQEGNFLLGYCYLLQNEFDRASETFNQFINKYPANINVSQAKKLIKRISDLTTL